MRIFVIVISLTTLVACKSNDPKSESKNTETTNEGKPAPPPMDSATIMQAFEIYMMPGEFHKTLAGFNGNWKSEMKYRESPEVAMRSSGGSAEYKMILGGRFQEARYTGSMLGMPWEAISLLGYDNAKKMFVASWADNFGTCIVSMEGTWDDDTKTIQFRGKTTDPISGKYVNIRENFRFVDQKTLQLETFMDIGGKEYKNMEMTFTKI